MSCTTLCVWCGSLSALVPSHLNLRWLQKKPLHFQNQTENRFHSCTYSCRILLRGSKKNSADKKVTEPVWTFTSISLVSVKYHIYVFFFLLIVSLALGFIPGNHFAKDWLNLYIFPCVFIHTLQFSDGKLPQLSLLCNSGMMQ